MMRSLLLSMLFIVTTVSAVTQISAQTTKPVPEDEIYKVDTDLIDVPVAVTDKAGKPILNLKLSNFTVLEDGKPQQVSDFASTNAPFEVALFLDTSGSTRSDLRLIQNAARNFIESLRPGDRVAVISFSTTVRDDRETAVPQVVSGLSSDRNPLSKALDSIGTSNGTPYYDGLLQIVKEVFASSPDDEHRGRRALVALTDGVDSTSIAGFDEAEEMIGKAGINCYFIQVDTRDFFEENLLGDCSSSKHFSMSQIRRYYRTFSSGGREMEKVSNFCQLGDFERLAISKKLYEVADEEMKTLSRVSGGRVFPVADLGAARDAFRSVATEIGTKYSLGYYSSNERRDGGYRKITVQLKGLPAGSVVRAREGYTAPCEISDPPTINMNRKFDRFCLMVLDSAGIGAMPDAAEWGDAGADTLGHILSSRKVDLPNLRSLGLGNIRNLDGNSAVDDPIGNFGKCTLRSNGKDTTTGHWEMAGIVLEKAFPTFPKGFPDRIIAKFVQEAAVPGVLGNVPASGTEIIRELGEEHMRTGKPIVYTSADSVFQIAAHEEVVPLDRLYEMCEIARRVLDGEDRVGRIIARPFVGSRSEDFTRTENRHDYAVPPPINLLPILRNAGLDTVCIGKIASIYDGVGVSCDMSAKNNEQTVSQTIAALGEDTTGLIFSNLVDFDMLYGHRRDTEGYAKALERFDSQLPSIMDALGERDVLILTADHGNDPTKEGSDHTREYVPLLVYGRSAAHGVDLGTRGSLADIGQTIAENFGLTIPAGKSFLSDI